MCIKISHHHIVSFKCIYICEYLPCCISHLAVNFNKIAIFTADLSPSSHIIFTWPTVEYPYNVLLKDNDTGGSSHKLGWISRPVLHFQVSQQTKNTNKGKPTEWLWFWLTLLCLLQAWITKKHLTFLKWCWVTQNVSEHQVCHSCKQCKPYCILLWHRFVLLSFQYAGK